jgi:hypothetical protein
MPSKDEEQVYKSKEWLVEQAKRSLTLRSKDREFHGLERELLYSQSQMLVDYERTKDIKHPRDVGSAREEILGKFFVDSGLLPKKYAVSKASVRVASTSGHVSRELDILFFDEKEAIVLMQRQDVYEVYPVETCYGAIQVKSKLTKHELQNAFANVSSFKKLSKVGVTKPSSDHGFAVIFAYDTDLEWTEVVDEIKKLSSSVQRQELPNAVVILSKGLFLYGDGTAGKFLNQEIETLAELKVHGFPDRMNQCLYSLYSILLTLLRSSEVCPVPSDMYFRLPQTSGDLSYEFALGFLFDTGYCAKHGDYQRRISQKSLEKLMSYCSTHPPEKYTEAVHSAYGISGPGGRFFGMPEYVWVYNPEGCNLCEILVTELKSFSCDHIRCEGRDILVPHYYSAREGIVEGCPKCKSPSYSDNTSPKPNPKK